MPAQQAFKTREPFVDRVSDLMRSVSGRKRIARMQNAPADVVKVDQLAFGKGQGQRRSSRLMPGRNLVGRRHRHREEVRIYLPQLVDYATEPPVFCEGIRPVAGSIETPFATRTKPLARRPTGSWVVRSGVGSVTG